MYIRLLSVLCCFVSLCLQASAQSKKSHPLTVSWQPLLNNYAGKEHALSTLTLTNSSDTDFPWEGWKLYFNFIRLAEPVDDKQPLDVQHINGDYFYFVPNAKGKTLKPGEQVTYTMISKSWVVNFNDAPQGFYLDWGGDKQEALGAVTILTPPDAKAFYRVGGDAEMDAEKIYAKNLRYQADGPLAKGQVLPTPVSTRVGKGAYTLKNNIAIHYDAEFLKEGELLKTELEGLFRINSRLLPQATSRNTGIALIQDNTLAVEAYTLDVSKTGITLRAGTQAGMFYAIQSLKLLVDPAQYDAQHQAAVTVPYVAIKDVPRFGSRSLMLDVARNFQSKAQILKVLDVMALYKLNTLHFHLNDDEGWRLEVPSFPELTAVGARRGHWTADGNADWLPPSYGSGPSLDNPRASGFYSQADFIEILQYAQSRHIQVIPEVETPGHARAAIQAMNSRYRKLMATGDTVAAHKYLLQSPGDSSEFRSVQKWNDNVMDLSLPSVYTFLEQLTDDIVGLYKQAGVELQTIHFGGDEVPNGVWEGSPAFAKLKAADATINDPFDLWTRHFDILYNMLQKRGLDLSGWEEVGMEKMLEDGRKKWVPYAGFQDRNIYLNVWNNLGGNEDLAYRLANAGYKVKLSFVSNFYMDMAYYKAFREQGFYWGGFIDMERPYSFVPFDYLHTQKQDWLGRPLPERVLAGAEKLTEKGKKNIVGLQASLWSETIKSEKEMERMLFPRLLAFSERAWAQPGVWEQGTENQEQAYQAALTKFFQLVGAQELQRLPFIHGGVAYRIPTPGLSVVDGQVFANMELPGFDIRYTEDGADPTLSSKRYTGPIAQKTGLVFRAFNKQGDASLPITWSIKSTNDEK